MKRDNKIKKLINELNEMEMKLVKKKKVSQETHERVLNAQSVIDRITKDLDCINKYMNSGQISSSYDSLPQDVREVIHYISPSMPEFGYTEDLIQTILRDAYGVLNSNLQVSYDTLISLFGEIADENETFAEKYVALQLAMLADN